MIGREGPQLRGRVDRRDIERFAIASQDSSPIHRDESAAAAAGYEGLPSPPLLLSSILEWGAGPPIDELRADGTGVGREGWLPLANLRLMGGGQDLVLHDPVLAGTEFIATPALESIELKGASGRELLFIVIVTEFRSTDGTPLVTCRETLIAR